MGLNETASYNRIIIGGGASGMAAAVFSARAGADALIIEKNDVLGKKIYATGNGRCNFANTDNDYSNYFADDKDFLDTLVDAHNGEWTIEFFKSLGIEPYIEEGRVYPRSEQAKSVVLALKDEIKRLGVDTITNTTVLKVSKLDDNAQADGRCKNKQPRFEIKTDHGTFMCHDLIIATGLGSSVYAQDKCLGIEIAQKFGIACETSYPALCKLMTNDEHFKSLAGIRARAHASLYVDGEIILSEQGQLQFNEDSISGIPVMQFSGEANRAYARGAKVQVKIDLAPGVDIKEYISHKSDVKAKNVFNGLLPDKLGVYIIRQMGIPENVLVRDIDPEKSFHFDNFVHKFKVNVSSISGARDAQTATGGILTSELTASMESKNVPGLYFTGELINIYGKCGGYNLQLAWASAAATTRNL